MGTRSTIKFYSEYNQDEPIACVYQQFDGYIDGVGYELAEFLKDITITNGISGSNEFNGTANGMGCLVAQFIMRHKTELGGLYMTSKNNSQDYDYEVRYKDGQLIIKVDDFEGTPLELLKYKPE